MAPPIHYRLLFPATPSGHGGNRRTMQVLDLFSRYQLEHEVIRDKIGGGSKLSQVGAMLRGFPPGPSAPLSRFLSLKGLRNYGLMRRIGKTMNVCEGSVVIFDAFVCAYVTLFENIRNRGGRVIVLPHNIDSLSPGIRHPISNAMSPKWSNSEIAALAKADLVCCISREEQWLLSLYGIEACYLPYEPTPENRSRLLEIRKLRANQTKDVVLIIGTAGNIPTLRGMQALLERAPDLVNAAKGFQVVVLGYGTEALRPLVKMNESSITILGGVSEDVLNRYLLRASVSLVYQIGTTGVLTRIQELLYGGIPIIANHIAARSYHNVPGVQVAETINDMFDMLASHQLTDFAQPTPPIKLEQQLVERIRKLQNLA